jgi:hypothetical protein
VYLALWLAPVIALIIVGIVRYQRFPDPEQRRYTRSVVLLVASVYGIVTGVLQLGVLQHAVHR